ncbi:MAG TPA: hypothetical protein VFM94_04145 [Solirubrobacterales bacterium]|nr:hypothetical protein [Solirubrobacterales bacterium]
MLLAPAAFAAAPANDEFANRIDLSGTLPIEETGTNVAATQQADEHPGEFLYEPAEHSVWFSWEAEDTEWVTVSTCGSDFDTLLGVYSGSSLSFLEKVVPGKEGARFDCAPGGQQVTFRALAGTTYEIRVDGNLSPQPPAATEGSIALEIASTPAPGNDDFADAQVVTSESFDGGTFYRVDVPGFNWNATKELGEPAHAGDQGGASVWYSWTAPASGEASVVAASGALEAVLGVYTGTSLSELTPVATPTYFPGEVDVQVTAGTTYLIAVDGMFDGGAGMASMGQLTFLIYLRVPPADLQTGIPFKPVPPVADQAAPQTTISKSVFKRMPPVWVFRFSSNEPGSTFECKLDKRPFAKCRSSKTFKHPSPGRHTLKARAIDPSGNVDPTPAVAHFIVPRKTRAK